MNRYYFMIQKIINLYDLLNNIVVLIIPICSKKLNYAFFIQRFNITLILSWNFIS